jgi:hypothetical protein
MAGLMVPLPEGVTWAVLDPDGNIVRYGTEPIELHMTTQLGEQFEQAGQFLLAQAAKTKEG